MPTVKDNSQTDTCICTSTLFRVEEGPGPFSLSPRTPTPDRGLDDDDGPDQAPTDRIVPSDPTLSESGVQLLRPSSQLSRGLDSTTGLGKLVHQHFNSH